MYRGSRVIRFSLGDMGTTAKNLLPELIAGVDSEIKTKFKPFFSRPDVRKYIASEYIFYVSEFVPMKTGELRDSAKPYSDGRVSWDAVDPNTKEPYAYKQYTTQYKHYSTPNTGPYWMYYFQSSDGQWSAFIRSTRTTFIRALSIEARSGQKVTLNTVGYALIYNRSGGMLGGPMNPPKAGGLRSQQTGHKNSYVHYTYKQMARDRERYIKDLNKRIWGSRYGGKRKKKK